MEDIIKILNEFRPDIDFTSNERLIEDGILDSLDIVNIVAELDSEFDIEIPVEDIAPENFNSAAAIKKLVDGLREES
jgi:D-alanine--poly(phosphoribitol) ligase subunit 2